MLPRRVLISSLEPTLTTCRHFTGFEIITNEIETKQKGWDALFEADNFFQRYKWYLQVYAWALDSEVQRKW